jgi:DNA-binding Xre family transcriptional regulator
VAGWIESGCPADSGGHVEIPWSTIRALTDREYAAHLAEAAEEQARQIGLRIRELRELRGLSSNELAERAGITPQSLSRIEHGHHDVVFRTLRRILAAMGCSLRDLATDA